MKFPSLNDELPQFKAEIESSYSGQEMKTMLQHNEMFDGEIQGYKTLRYFPS